MPQPLQERIRLKFAMNVVAASVDDMSAAAADAYARTDWRVEMAFSRSDVLVDVSEFLTLRVQVMYDEDRTGAALLDRVTAAFVPTITQEAWEAGGVFQAAVEFSAAETNIDFGGKKERTLYLVASATTTAGKVIVAGFATIRLVESGAFKDAAQPPQGGSIVPGGVSYDGSGNYTLAVTVASHYSFTKGVNDTGYTNGGSPITADGNFTAASGTVVLSGTPAALVTAIVRAEVYLTVAEADARYFTHRRTITQADHGLAVGEVVRQNGSEYVKAIATSAAAGEKTGVVQYVDGDTFVLVSSGRLTGLADLIPGEIYWVSANVAGAVSLDAPTGVGQLQMPVFQAVTASEAFVLNMRGMVVQPAPDPVWNRSEADERFGVKTKGAGNPNGVVAGQWPDQYTQIDAGGGWLVWTNTSDTPSNSAWV